MSLNSRIRIALRCQDPLVEAGLASTLLSQMDFELQAAEAAASQPLALDTVDPLCPDVLVADYESALGAMRHGQLRQRPPQEASPKVLIVTGRHSGSEIRHALEAGARGYIVVGCRLNEIVDGVRAVHKGMRYLSDVATHNMAESLLHEPLTARETQVVRLVARGYPNKAIGAKLDITVGTVKTHVKGILRKLQAASRTEATAVAERRGLLASPESASGTHRIPELWRHASNG
jgi:two-component system response regulator DesR